MATEPGIYRHHGGGLYTVLGEARDSTNATEGRRMVLYVSHTTGNLCVRDAVEFHELIGAKGGSRTPRFALLAYGTTNHPLKVDAR